MTLVKRHELKRPDNAIPLGTQDVSPLVSLLMDRRRVNTDRVVNLSGGLGTSVVSPVLTSFASAFTEPSLVVERRIEGEMETIHDHPVVNLWEQPNQTMIGEMLGWYVVASIVATGSAYLYKLRDGANNVLELLPLYPTRVSPHTPSDGSALIDYWEYLAPGSFSPIRLEMEDVIHLRWGIDPDDHRRGWSPLKPVMTEVMADDEAGQFATGLLQNLGIPGVVLTPLDDYGVDPEEGNMLGDEWMSRFTGPNRGRPYIPSGPMRAQIVSFSPQQMDLTGLRRLPEERVSAALNWPAILAGLGAGLERATYSNVTELREFATEQSLVPKWRITQRQLTLGLRDDFDLNDSSLAFDLSEVRALQQDQHALAERWTRMVAGGWATVAEARRALDLPVEDRHEVFLRGTGQIEVPDDDALEAAVRDGLADDEA